MRFLYIFISVVILAMVPISNDAFGISTFIFGFGMIYDYTQVVYVESKTNKANILMGYIGLAISIILALVGIMALINCIELVTSSGTKMANVCIVNNPMKFAFFNFRIKYSTFAWLLLIFPFWAGLEGFLQFKRLNQIKETQPA